MLTEDANLSGRSPIIDGGSRLAHAQLSLALRNLRPNSWLMPLFGAVICVMFSHWLPVWRLSIWWFIVVAGALPLGVVCARSPKPEDDVPTWSRWRMLAILTYLLFTACWASMSFFLWVPGDEMNHMLVIVILTSTIAANAAIIGASRPLTIAGFSVYGITLVVTPLQEGGMLYIGLAVLALLYLGYLIHLSNTFYRTSRDMLLLRDDKDELIVALARSNMESDEARKRAETANRTKSEFLANMSHELRTPLNAIIGFSEMINSGMFANKDVEYSKLINESGHHLLSLINDILDLAKIEAGRLTLQETDVDLHLMIMDCIALMHAKAVAGNLDLAEAISPDLPIVFADDRALRQVFINLLSNAVKFTPAGGKIEIEAYPQSDGTVAIRVSDTGLGIAQDDLQRVFENFGQGRHDVVSTEKGTGLGLPIVKGLVAAHGGSIALQSHVGRGTSITIVLPADRVRGAVPLKVAS